MAGFQGHAILKIDQNQKQNRSLSKVQNLGNERRKIKKDPRQDSGQRKISYTKYPKKCFTEFIEVCVETPCWCPPGNNMADKNHEKHLLPSFATKA